MECFHASAEAEDVHMGDMSDMGDMPQSTSHLTYVSNTLSVQEYDQQTREFTKQQLSELLASPEYQGRLHTCGTCWSPWLEAVSRADCMECGGFPLQRPCPVCKGKCGKIWQRDVETSHSNHEAHWEGDCGLPWEQQRLHLQLILTKDLTDENAILEAMQGLTTRQVSTETEQGTSMACTHWAEETTQHSSQTNSNAEKIIGNDFGHWCEESDVNSMQQHSDPTEMQL